MKITSKTENFQPFTIKIVIETKEEYETLYAMVLKDKAIPAILEIKYRKVCEEFLDNLNYCLIHATK